MPIPSVRTGFKAFECQFQKFEQDSKHSNAKFQACPRMSIPPPLILNPPPPPPLSPTINQPSLCISVSWSSLHPLTSSTVLNPCWYHLPAVADPHPYTEVNSCHKWIDIYYYDVKLWGVTSQCQPTSMHWNHSLLLHSSTSAENPLERRSLWWRSTHGHTNTQTHTFRSTIRFKTPCTSTLCI